MNPQSQKVSSVIPIQLCNNDQNRTSVSNLLASRSDIAQDLLFNIYDMILLENRSEDWSLSRALFSLSVLQKENLFERSNYIVKCQPAELQEQVFKLISPILSSAEFTLTLENRDKFTDSITQYKREVISNNIILAVPTNQN
ncbi:Exportin-7 [Smittium culicis]|uniref:Exportin-7 n=1 Tax=Smittium culicis TaxID=133412 RepID=A0A1R1X7E3_9FUNG|nr:Exportin-7 [Smittium culicis]